MTWEKMSKSRGNVITPDEVTYGVADLQRGWEFRFCDGEVLTDFKAWGVWRNRLGDSLFYTSTRTGKQPVFLCQQGDPGVPALIINGQECDQHPSLLVP